MTKIPVRYADKPDLTTNRFNKILDDLEKQGTNHPTNMTDDLTKKLEKILFGDAPRHFMSDNMLAKPEQITQAFITAGWMKQDPPISIDGLKYMTGQEWYNRFLNALTGEVLRTDKRLPQLKDCEFVFDAAKKASGIES